MKIKAVFLDYDERNAQEVHEILPLLVTYNTIRGKEIVEREEFWLKSSPLKAKKLEASYHKQLKREYGMDIAMSEKLRAEINMIAQLEGRIDMNDQEAVNAAYEKEQWLLEIELEASEEERMQRCRDSW